jgi:hypothetical protein
MRPKITMAGVRKALLEAGYDPHDRSPGPGLIVKVSFSDDDDEALEDLRSIVEPLGYAAEYMGEGNTDADGYSTEDVSIDPAPTGDEDGRED